MVYVPQATFSMGSAYEGPVHNVFTNAFFADRFEVTSALWANVLTWATAHGYSIASGTAVGPNHPIISISWHDAVKWCNARSEKDGLAPVYYTGGGSVVYRTGEVNITTDADGNVKWSANGYRLPTEAEWEKAARGGLVQQDYPWGNSIANGDANSYQSGHPYSSGNPPTTPVGYYNGSQTPTGPNRANGYGLYDMAGNVQEWCWDWYDSSFYATSSAGNNPQGPTTGNSRIIRGGGWGNASGGLRCAYRSALGPSGSQSDLGFRCVRGL